MRPMRLDPRLTEDVDNVLEAAALLDTSEFNVFHLAYRHWYGQDPAPGVVERAFVPYMFADRVPQWVRAFARQVVARGAAGTIDPSEYGVQGRPPSRAALVAGRLYVVLTLLATAVLLLLSNGFDYSDLLEIISNCYFPPCY